MPAPANRTVFLIDGFNLYHSLRDAGKELRGQGTRWLDVVSLCRSYLHGIGNGATLERIYYFSALATHLEHQDPGIVERHKRLIKVMQFQGVEVVLGRFKEKQIRCNVKPKPKGCSGLLIRHEEKETDVAISVKLMELCCFDRCDTAVLVTGDTDLAPAVRTVNHLFPQKKICFLFPYTRKNDELAKLAHKSFTIKRNTYPKHQLPDPVIIDGLPVHKPGSW